MESSIAEFLKRRYACELLPTTNCHCTTCACCPTHGCNRDTATQTQNERSAHDQLPLGILAEGAIAQPVTFNQRCAVVRCASALLLCHKVAPSVPGSSAPHFSGGQGSWVLVVPPAFGHEAYAE